MVSGMMLCVLMLAVSGCLGMMLAHRFMLMLLLKGQADERRFLRNHVNQFGLWLYLFCGDARQNDLGAVMSAEAVRENYRRQGEKRERERLVQLLMEQKVIRKCAATGLLVFVNCNTGDVLYLKDDLLNESAK
jgi:hypothetical protein